MDWTDTLNPLINGSIQQKSLNYYLETVADILQQYEQNLSTILLYFKFLDVNLPETFDNLKNSLSYPIEFQEKVTEFLGLSLVFTKNAEVNKKS